MERSMATIEPAGKIGFIESSTKRVPIVCAGFGSQCRLAMIYPSTLEESSLGLPISAMG